MDHTSLLNNYDILKYLKIDEIILLSKLNKELNDSINVFILFSKLKKDFIKIRKDENKKEKTQIEYYDKHNFFRIESLNNEFKSIYSNISNSRSISSNIDNIGNESITSFSTYDIIKHKHKESHKKIDKKENFKKVINSYIKRKNENII